MRCWAAVLGLLLVGAGAWAEEPAVVGRKGGAAAPFLGLSSADVRRADLADAPRLQHVSALGPAYVQTAPIRWGRIESAAPPRGGRPTYDWSTVDAAILLWQLAGFEPVPVLSPKSAWANVPLDKTDWVVQVTRALGADEAEAALRAELGAAPPRPGAWSAWERFVRDFIERYDADGKDDMPGLRRPVTRVQVLDRMDVPTAWLGSAEEYLRLLHHAGVAAEAAHEPTRIVHAAFDLRATGHAPFPDAEMWRQRIRRALPAAPAAARLELERAFELVQRTLEMPRLFQVVAVLASESVHDDTANLTFVRRYLDERGAEHVAVWLVDDPNRKLGASRVPGAPRPEADEERIHRRWLPAALNPRHSEHETALAWLRRGQAYDVVRSFCAARHAGADAVLFRPAGERRLGGPAAGRRHAVSIDDFFVGTDSTLAPTWYACRQLNRLLRGHGRVEASVLGAPGRAFVFHMSADHEPPWVAVFFLHPELSWAGTPGTAASVREVTAPIPNGAYVLEACRLDAAAPARREVRVTNGILRFELGPAPVYVVPVP